MSPVPYLVAMLAVTVKLEESREQGQDDGEGQDVQKKRGEDDPGHFGDRHGQSLW